MVWPHVIRLLLMAYLVRARNTTEGYRPRSLWPSDRGRPQARPPSRPQSRPESWPSDKSQPEVWFSSRCVPGCRCSMNYIQCSEKDTLDSVPLLDEVSAMSNITHILITDQPRLKRLSSTSLKNYVNLEKITIQHSGLETVEPETFNSNLKLMEIDLQNNNLVVFPWQLIDALDSLTELILMDNPLACNCSMRWLQLEQVKKTSRLGAYGHLPCTDTKTGLRHELSEIAVPNCELPTVQVMPHLVELNISENTSIHCNASGSPRPKLQWRGVDHVSGKEERVDGATGISLSLYTVQPNDTGMPACVASNIVGQTVVYARVLVKSPPRIINLGPPTDFYWSWTIPYEIMGHPEPTVTWLRNGQPLEPGAFKRVDNRGSLADPPSVLHYGGLELKRPMTSDGLYTLLASNPYGNDSRTLMVDLPAPGDLWPEDGGKILPVGPVNVSTPRQEEHTSSDEKVYSREKLFIGIAIAVGVTATMALLLLVLFLNRHHRRLKRDSRFSKGLFHLLCAGGQDGGCSKRQAEVIARETMPLHSRHVVENTNYGPNKMHAVGSASAARQVSRDRIQFVRKLGEGAFGEVHLGMCENLTPGEDLSLVAIKALKDSYDADESARAFDREAEILTSLQHPNIVTFHGISIDCQPLMMIFEYMENGDLSNFLRENGPDASFLGKSSLVSPPLTVPELLRVSSHVAAGMEYLASQHFVHRDLATRNCLVADRLIVKIGDFGMSRDVYSTDYYKVGGQAMLPVRWMPPESILYRTFTVESDVWSFGVVLWEIFTYGKQPWYEFSNHEVIQQIQNAKLLECPRVSPEGVNKIMVGCWRRQPSERLTMREICRRLEELSKVHQPEYLEVIG